ncbi:hypothetical protein HPB58_12255 [Priestia filamentosa]|uniref:hypothetical protein n=1 Tax=Priestia filamentosa TaxID=1402861 RepID=UPI001FB40DC2|nr:hypothetical protein [Priestia filamentosa]UOE62892.1 hypothetical protein HPB58_12255 [Priestia filamentosa]
MGEENREKLNTLSTNLLSALLKNRLVSELPDDRKAQIKAAIENFSEKVNELPDERKVQIEAALENLNTLMNASSENKTNGIPESRIQSIIEKVKKAQEDTNKE